MKNIQNLTTEYCSADSTTYKPITKEVQIQRYNEEEGYLKGKDCRLCKNKGYIMVLEEGYTTLQACECQRQRNNKVIVERSGMKSLIADYTFENFTSKEMWQRITKEKAQAFVQDQAHCFFIGGQVGSGKTHICTAIVNELMNQGNETLYMLWRNEIVKLKANAMEGPEYQKAMQQYKTIKVLYIDDLFKTEKGKSPTTADINIVFEILNTRYLERNLITIISSEKNIKEVIAIDEAIGSRIFEMAGYYCVQIKNNDRMNMRLRERNLHE